MSYLSWGKCTISIAESTDGTPDDSWVTIDTPKEETTKLTETAGDKVEAKEEGGDVVDARYKKGTAELEFDLFGKKGVDQPFESTDGVIDGEYGIRVAPEDTSCKGIQIDRATITVTRSYSTADGILYHYVATALKPASGKMVKEYTPADLD